MRALKGPLYRPRHFVCKLPACMPLYLLKKNRLPHFVHSIPLFGKQQHSFCFNDPHPRRDGNDTKTPSLRNPAQKIRQSASGIRQVGCVIRLHFWLVPVKRPFRSRSSAFGQRQRILPPSGNPPGETARHCSAGVPTIWFERALRCDVRVCELARARERVAAGHSRPSSSPQRRMFVLSAAQSHDTANLIAGCRLPDLFVRGGGDHFHLFAGEDHSIERGGAVWQKGQTMKKMVWVITLSSYIRGLSADFLSARIYHVFGCRWTERRFGVLPTHRAGGVEAPERKLEVFSRRTLARLVTKLG